MRKLFILIMCLGILTMSSTAIAASIPDIMLLEEPCYTHKKGIVQFDHKKHSQDYFDTYPELYPNGCGDCHHDKNGEPILKLKDEDIVQRCIDCHMLAGEAPKGKKAKVKLSKKEKIKDYHANAFHANCKGCHKKFNKAYKPKKAPTTCIKCHPKKEK